MIYALHLNTHTQYFACASNFFISFDLIRFHFNSFWLFFSLRLLFVPHSRSLAFSYIFFSASFSISIFFLLQFIFRRFGFAYFAFIDFFPSLMGHRRWLRHFCFMVYLTDFPLFTIDSVMKPVMSRFQKALANTNWPFCIILLTYLFLFVSFTGSPFDDLLYGVWIVDAFVPKCVCVCVCVFVLFRKSYHLNISRIIWKPNFRYIFFFHSNQLQQQRQQQQHIHISICSFWAAFELSFCIIITVCWTCMDVRVHICMRLIWIHEIK